MLLFLLLVHFFDVVPVVWGFMFGPGFVGILLSLIYCSLLLPLCRLAPVIKTIFHQCVISYTCSQSTFDGAKPSHRS